MQASVALVVDDNDDAREMIGQTMEDAGFRVVYANDGIEALSQLANIGSPDVVVLDLMMPRMSGWELIEQMRSLPGFRTVPVVAVSALHYSGPTRRLFDEVLPKADVGQRLVKTCRAVIEARG